MAEILFDEAEAQRQTMEGVTSPDDTGGEEILFDEATAQQQAGEFEASRRGAETGIDYTNEMRTLLGMPSREEEAGPQLDATGQPVIEEPVEPTQEDIDQQIAGQIGNDMAAASEQVSPLTLGKVVEGTVETIGKSIETTVHQVKMLGETLVMSTSELADFLQKTNNWVSGGGFEIPQGFEVNGIKIGGGVELEQLAHDAITSAYGTVGLEPKLEEVRDIDDIAVKLIGYNLGPSFAINGVANLLSKVAGKRQPIASAEKFSSWSRSFLASEFGIGASGAIVGTTAAAITDGELKEQMAVAELGNLAGIAGGIVAQIAKTPAAFNRIVEIKDKLWKILKGEPDEVYDKKAQEVVDKFIASMVPSSELPAVRARMTLVRRVQEKYPDFKPSMGNVVGTEEMRKVQRLNDSANPERATEQFLKTQNAVGEMISDLSRVSDPSQRAQIASALRLYADDTAIHMRNLQDQMVASEDAARAVNTIGFSSSKSGNALRTDLKAIKEQYRLLKNKMFDDIDPDDLAQFNPGQLLNKMDDLKNSDELDLLIDPSESTFTYLSKTLPNFIKRIKTRNAETGVDTVSFNELHAIRMQLGKRIRNVSRADPESNGPNVMAALKNDIDELLDNRMMSGDPEVADRYRRANEFYMNEYVEKFKNGVGGDLLETTGRSTNDYTIRADAVGDEFWKSGSKEVNLEQFNEIFKLQNVELLGEFGTETAEVAIKMARNNLKEHALQTLDVALKASPKGRPLDILNRWKQKFRGALKTFDDIDDEIKIIEKEMADVDSMKVARTSKIDRMNSNIIRKYADTDASELIPALFKGTPEETARRMEDIFAAARTKGPVPLEQVESLRLAVKEGSMQHIMNEAYNPKTGLVKWEKIDEMLNKTHKEHLKFLFQPEELQNLSDARDVFKLIGTETKPITTVELNKVKEVFDKFGFSPASVLSRYYSHQLGKVGGLYLFVDGATRFFTKASDKYFKRAYERSLYDLDGLERALKHVGSDEAANVAADLNRSLREKFKNVTNASIGKVRNHIKSFFNQNSALKAYRFAETIESGIEGNAGDLTYSYLMMNDDQTGQDSRLATQLFVDPTDEEMDAELEAFVPRSISDQFGPTFPDQEIIVDNEAEKKVQEKQAELQGVSPEVIAEEESEVVVPTKVPTEEDSLEDPSTFSIEEVNATPIEGKAILAKGTGFFGRGAIAQVESREGALSEEQARVVELEGYVNKPYLDTSGNVTIGVGQTGKFMTKTFKESFEEHADRARTRIPEYDNLPGYLRAELVQAEYRGDLGFSPKTVSLFNEGKFEEASVEFLDNKNFKNDKTPDSIKARIQSVSDAISRFGTEQGELQLADTTPSAKAPQADPKARTDVTPPRPQRTIEPSSPVEEGIGAEQVAGTAGAIAPAPRLDVQPLPETLGNPTLAGQTTLPNATLNERIKGAVNPFV